MYRQLRKQRRIHMLLVTMVLILFFTGICLTDRSINTIMNGDNSLKIISINAVDNKSVNLCFYDKRYSINISFFYKNLQKIKRVVQKVF